jgi:hypothetical protein
MNLAHTEQQLAGIARCLEEAMPGMGFALLVFEFNAPGVSNYVSNAERADMIQALRETADRLEQHHDLPPAVGHA